MAGTVGAGDLTPYDQLTTPAGRPTSLTSFRGEATLLIYLRHLA
jgi:hypothetical protein